MKTLEQAKQEFKNRKPRKKRLIWEAARDLAMIIDCAIKDGHRSIEYVYWPNDNSYSLNDIIDALEYHGYEFEIRNSNRELFYTVSGEYRDCPSTNLYYVKIWGWAD